MYYLNNNKVDAFFVFAFFPPSLNIGSLREFFVMHFFFVEITNVYIQSTTAEYLFLHVFMFSFTLEVFMRKC